MLPGVVPFPPEFAARYRAKRYWEDIAADLDAATGGFSKVLPVAKAITRDGILDLPADRLREAVRTMPGTDPDLLTRGGIPDV